MKFSASRVVAVLAAAFPSYLILVIAGGIGVLALLVYVGVVLPAVWSAKPARRKAAVAVLYQILVILRHQ
jgi:hypothetical protein